MARAPQPELRLRVVVEDPVAGVLHSLQDPRNHPIAAQRSTGAPLVFEFAVRVAAGPRFLGAQVRREGPTRRFVYVAVGKPAGDAASCWERRMKIDIHTIAQPLIDQAVAGKVLEVVVAGAGKDGTPACATVTPKRAWRAVAK